MGDSLTFMMGEFEALFPTDRRYATNHMWCQSDGSQHRFGFTAYAVRLLQDVYFLDWAIEAPARVNLGQEIGSIESKKAESSLYAPLAGNIVEFNDVLMDDPSAINTDKYAQGWLFDMAVSESNLMSPPEYVEYLNDVWAKTQRTIKGQLNE